MANIESQGTVFFWSATTAASTATTRTVGQVVGFTGPGGAANVIDVTHLGSTMREKRMGLPDEGTFTMDVLLDMTESSGQQSIRADRAVLLQSFVDVLSIIRDLGFTSMSLQTEAANE